MRKKKKNLSLEIPERGRTKKKDPSKKPLISAKLWRGILGMFIILVVVFFLGSIFIRNKVIQLLRAREVSAASAVLSRSYEIEPGLNFLQARIPERLKRLGYEKVSTKPKSPGEWSIQNGTGQNIVDIYLHEFYQETGAKNLAQVFSLMLAPNGEILRITDTSSSKQVYGVRLEPEMLSLLSNSSTRASTPKSFTDFPKNLLNAVLAIEDERFYSHLGVDPIGIARAIFVNIRSGGFVQGGSTLTQQLAKNLLYDNERSLRRKFLEFFSAIMIETAFTKEKIFELYLNEIFLAQEGSVAIHGFAEAAQSFFKKDVKEITLAESALLAGIIKAPSKYAPRKSLDLAKERMQVVLEKMLSLGYITEAQKNAAIKEKIEIRPAERSSRIAPYFVDYIKRTLDQTVDISGANLNSLKVFTTLDPEFQNCAGSALKKGLAELEKNNPSLKRKKNPLQAAIIVTNPSSGEILAWVGGRDYGKNQFDRVSLAKRQPGSSFKPFVYLTALDKNLNTYRVARTTNLLSDEPITINIPGVGPWRPENYDREYRGMVTVREALTRSLNIPTVELAQKVGISKIAATARLFGFGNDLPEVPSLALGAGEVSPLEMARAYGGLASGGKLIDLNVLKSVINTEGNAQLFQATHREQAISSPAAVYILTTILQDVVNRGTGRSIRNRGYQGVAAGKTGTTNDARDAWFAGFTPELLAVVWLGYDDNSKVGLTGGAAAAPIWGDFMKCAFPLTHKKDFVVPTGVVFRQIDPRTGLLYAPSCGGSSVEELFVEGTEPITYCRGGEISEDLSREMNGDNRSPEVIQAPSSFENYPREQNHRQDNYPNQAPNQALDRQPGTNTPSLPDGDELPSDKQKYNKNGERSQDLPPSENDDFDPMIDNSEDINTDSNPPTNQQPNDLPPARTNSENYNNPASTRPTPGYINGNQPSVTDEDIRRKYKKREESVWGKIFN